MKTARKAMEAKKNETKEGKNALKKPYRFKPGMVALHYIQRYQKSAEFLFKVMPFACVVREICHRGIKEGIKFQSDSLKALQEATETYLVRYFEDILLSTIHAQHTMVQMQDAWLVK